MEWILDLETVSDDGGYIVFAIANKSDGSGTYVYKPQVLSGRQVKRLLKGCYAAVKMPEWKGRPSK